MLDLDQSNPTLQKHFSKIKYLIFDFSNISDEKILIHRSFVSGFQETTEP